MSQAETDTTTAPAFPRDLLRVNGGILVVVLLCVVGMYWSTISMLVAGWMNWHSDVYGTAALVVPVSLYLAWERRAALLEQPQYRWVGICLVGMLGSAWWVAEIISLKSAQYLAVVALIPACVWAVAGWRTFTRWLFPAGFLVFSLPLGDFLVPALQDLTAAFSVKLLQLSQVPVFLEGRTIATPRRNWIVTDACSGMRWVLASAAFGYLFAGLFLRQWKRRVQFMLLAVLLPIVTNGFRAYIVPLLDYVSTDWLAQGVDDALAGWIFYAVIIGLLMWIGSRWQNGRFGVPTASGMPAWHGFSATVVDSWPMRVGVAVMTCVTAAVWPFWIVSIHPGENAAKSVTPMQVHMVPTPPWIEVAPEHLNWKPRFKGHAVELFQSFGSNGQDVALFMAFYPRQREGAEAMSAGNELFDSSWEQIGEGREPLTIDGQPVMVRRVDIRRRHNDQGFKRMILGWSWSGQTHTASHLVGKLLQLRSYVLGRQSQAIGLVLSATYLNDPAGALNRMQTFVRQHRIADLLRQSVSLPARS